MPTQDFFDRFPPFPEGLPVLDLPRLSYGKLIQGDNAETDALWDACVDEGFFLLDLGDAPGGPDLLEDLVKVYDIGRSFFDQDLDTKKEFKLNTGNVGYKPMGVIKYPDGRSDLTEVCAVSKDSILDAKNATVPAVFALERPFLTTICERLHPVAMTVLQALAARLDINAEQTFGAFHAAGQPSATVLRFLHNPPQASAAVADRYASLMGHTDNGSITVLFAGLGGLQILPAEVPDEPANWRWVRPEPGCAIINIGDSVVQWSGGLLRSSYHRVLHAPGAQAACERYSFGYFLKPANEAPMDRLQGSSIIPDADMEAEGAFTNETYALWHRNKTQGILKGENNVKSRGGLGARLKAARSVPEQGTAAG